MITSHVRQRFYAVSVAPIATLFYFQPTLAGAISTAVATAIGVKELLHRRKPNP